MSGWKEKLDYVRTAEEKIDYLWRKEIHMLWPEFRQEMDLFLQSNRPSAKINKKIQSGKESEISDGSALQKKRMRQQRILSILGTANRSSKSSFVKSGAKSSTKSQSSPGKTTSDNYQSEHKRNHVNRKQHIVRDWSEQKSSTGKKYYYDSKSGVSQWEKPKELMTLKEKIDYVRKEEEKEDYLWRKEIHMLWPEYKQELALFLQKIRPVKVNKKIQCGKESDISDGSALLKKRMRKQRILSMLRTDKSGKSSFVKSNVKSSTKSQSSPGKTTSDNYQSEHKRNDENGKQLIVGDWSKQKSSTEEKFCYNSKSDVSQCEKTKELIEYEQQQHLSHLSKYQSSHGENSNEGARNENMNLSPSAPLSSQPKQLVIILEDIMKSNNYKYQE